MRTSVEAPRLAGGSEIAGAVALSALWALLAFSLATALLFSQPAVGAIAEYAHADSADRAVLLESAEQIRRFTVGVESGIAVDPTGLAGLDRGALDHLLDVRTIVRVVGAVLLVAGVLAAVIAVAAASGGVNVTVLAASLRWAGAGVFAAVAVAGAVIAIGFDWFFVTFHHVLFADGTWTFSADSLLIRTFPEPFWIAAAVGWLAVVVAVAIVLLLAGLGVRGVAIRRLRGDSLVP